MDRSIKILTVLICLLWSSVAFAGDLHVAASATGNESGSDSSNFCTLATANSNLSAGDTAYLYDDQGTFDVATHYISPSNSGSAESKITYIAQTGEIPTFVWTTGYNPAISINGKDYIIVDGITGNDLRIWIRIASDADYNEIRNCSFSGCQNYDHCIRIWNGGSGSDFSNHNWIHDNTFSQCGYISSCNDQLSLWKIGEWNSDGGSGNNTIENNTISYGGHDCGTFYTQNNVIRNNHWHHEGWITNPGGCTYGPDSNGKYGNRNVEIECNNELGDNPAIYSLFEGNRFGASGASVDDDGGDGVTLNASKTVFRYNSIINSLNNGLLLKTGSETRGDDNRIYNNTIVWNGRYHNTGPQWHGYGIRFYSSQTPAHDNIIKNNLFYANATGDILHDDYHEPHTSENNTVSNNWLNANGDPKFTDDTHSDLTSSTQPDLNLEADSGAIDNGTYLTQASGSGSDSTTLVVDDALYFQDGTWGSSLSSVAADYIAIGTVTNTVQISSINYGTNTITLASAKTWDDNANIWLYKDSSGNVVLNGDAPDQGAFESGVDATPPSLSAFGPTGIHTYCSVKQIYCSSNENCTVKFGIVGAGGVTTSTPYDSLPYTMDTTGGISHSHQLAVSPGSYTIIFQGKDGSDNKSSNTGFTTSFTIQEQAGPELPVSAGRAISEGSHMGAGMSMP